MKRIESFTTRYFRRHKMPLYLLFVAGTSGTAWLFYDHLLPALLALPLFPYVVRRYDRLHAERRQSDLESQFRDLLFSLGASFATGRDLETALPEGEERLRRLYGDNLLVREIRRVREQTRQSGRPIVRGMEEWAKENSSTAIKGFMEVYSLCEETGADRGFAAGRAARLIADAIQSDQAFRAQTAQKRMELRLMAAIPLLLLLLLRISSDGYVSVLYATTAGKGIMTAALVAMAVSYLWSSALLEKGRS